VAKTWHVAALALYAAESWLFLDHGASLTGGVLGIGADPSLIMWFLAWWPWAFSHHALAWHTHLLWQPAGLNLAWTTCVPLLALLALPATLTGGPLLAFNLLTLAAPVLAGYGAFLLCLELFEAPAAALLGGWLFGFSAFEAAQSLDHLNLDFTVLIPLILLLALRRLRSRLGRKSTVVWLGLLLAGEFYISDELLALGLLFAAFAWALALAMIPARRVALLGFAWDVALAAPLALALAAPMLWGMLIGGFDPYHPPNWPWNFSTDALNFLLPTPTEVFGATAIAAHFTGGMDEQAGYLGLPMLAILLLAWRAFGALPEMRLAFAMLGIIAVASLGPVLHIAGRNSGIPLPWTLVLHLPLLGSALPARCMVFAALLAAILAAAWVATSTGRWRIWLALLACAAIFPTPHPAPAAPSLAFFAPGRLQAVLGPNPRILILPFAIHGASSFWQAENGFGFTQSGGYLGFPPAPMQHFAAVSELFDGNMRPHFLMAFKGFCTATGVQFVVLAPGVPPALAGAITGLGWPSRRVDDVTVLTVPSS